MKVCPSCKTQYTDDSLAFCLQDGSQLIAITPAPVGEAETVVRQRNSAVQDGGQSQTTRVARTNGSGSKMTVVIAVILLVFFGIVVVLALGLAWLFRPPGPAANNTPANNHNVNVPINFNRLSPTPMASPSPTSNVTTTLPTPFPNTIAVYDVTTTIERWRSAIASLDLESLMANYADTVDYYRRGPVSADVVRSDKARAFERFTTIQITLSNMNINVDPSGDRATAEFDKAWVFRAERSSSGKVRSQLRFSKINGRWLITSERDLSVYYTSK